MKKMIWLALMVFPYLMWIAIYTFLEFEFFITVFCLIIVALGYQLISLIMAAVCLFLFENKRRFWGFFSYLIFVHLLVFAYAMDHSGPFTLVYEETYDLREKNQDFEPSREPYFYISTYGTLYEKPKGTDGQDFREEVYKEPFVGYFSLVNQPLDRLDSVEIEIKTKDKIIQKQSLDGDQFEYSPWGNFSLSEFSLDLDTKTVKDLTINVRVKGSRNRIEKDYTLTEKYEIFHSKEIKDLISTYPMPT